MAQPNRNHPTNNGTTCHCPWDAGNISGLYRKYRTTSRAPSHTGDDVGISAY
jgi:hypothetical protein